MYLELGSMNAHHLYNYNPEARVRKDTLRYIVQACKMLPRNEFTQKRIKVFVQMIVRDLWDSTWTDVSEALPTKNGEYLVLTSGGGWYELAHYNGTYKQFALSNSNHDEPLEVKFWSCLPEPPRHISEKDDLEEIKTNEQ